MTLSNSILQSVLVSGTFINNIGTVHVTQQYLNTNTQNSEAIYTFNLDQNSSICSFVMEVGSKIITGYVVEKSKALKTYSESKEAGKKTSLLVKLSDSSYRVTIANINPNELITIKYSYGTTLQFETDGTFKFILPTNIAPKYTESKHQTITDIVNKKNHEMNTYNVNPEYKFNIDLSILT